MSLNSLATSRVARDRVAGRLSSASDDAVGPPEEDVQNALSALVEYIPAETITLYLAVMSSFSVIVKVVPGLSVEYVYWCFGILTPLLFAAIYVGKRRAAGESPSPGFAKWPWWPMVAATIAFLAWALAIPGGPYLPDGDGRALGGLIAIVVSTILGVLGRLFAPSPAPKPDAALASRTQARSSP